MFSGLEHPIGERSHPATLRIEDLQLDPARLRKFEPDLCRALERIRRGGVECEPPGAPAARGPGLPGTRSTRDERGDVVEE